MLKKDLDKDLQNIVIENYQFKNWAKTFTCSPELFLTPKTEEQVIKVYLFIMTNINKKFINILKLYFHIYTINK